MSTKADKLKEFDAALSKFGRFIKVNIQKFNLPKDGIDPDDVLQEVRIKIWKLLNDEKKITNYSSYIKKIVDSSVIDHLRRARRERGFILLEKQKTISEWKSHYETRNTDDKNLKKIVNTAVESLMESRRKVVKLYLLNLTIEEIATFYNWSRDKTRNLLYRGLSDLKKSLQAEGIEYEIK
ncbi:MAG: RNA polymerase sigma factor [Candidatus Aminicenantes bacterium]|nr:RNA polymerase sigma factor [Candidatus Aminicenantes bacterium]MDH5744568.1 RNA polymerase sigma factor [Candidatus Aminicenantes bacterium]